MNRTTKNRLAIIAEEVFQIFLVLYLLLLLLESLREGFVNSFFNINILLVVLLVSGAVMALTKDEKEERKQAVFAAKDLLFNALIAIFGGIFVFYKTQALGLISLLFALLSFLLIMLLSYLVINDTDNGS